MYGDIERMRDEARERAQDKEREKADARFREFTGLPAGTMWKAPQSFIETALGYMCPDESDWMDVLDYYELEIIEERS